MKIQSKITLLFLALSTGILILLNAFILYFEYQFNYRDFFKRLEARVNLAAQIHLLPGENNQAYLEVRNKYLERLEAEHQMFIKANARGKFATDSLPEEFYNDVVLNGRATYKEGNKFFAGKVVTTEEGKYLVVVTAQNPYGLNEIQDLQLILIIGFFGSLVIAFFVGKVFSAFTLEPVRKLIFKVNSITSENLHSRLDEGSGKDEIAELTSTFNNMLNRLETAFETQNNFVSNASHELRTPLTIINGELELALDKTTPDGALWQTLVAIQSETDKLIQMLNSLLTLAQSGYDGKKQNWQRVRVDELVLTSVESVKKIIPESDIAIDFANLPDDADQLYTLGNSNLLKLAFTNIISNSCKYSQNALVNVRLSIQNKNIVVSVIDHGIGIPATEVQHIFEPFFRASNTQEYSGHGVGLPLTLNILRLHKGTIGIRSEVGQGTEIQLFLPLFKK